MSFRLSDHYTDFHMKYWVAFIYLINKRGQLKKCWLECIGLNEMRICYNQVIVVRYLQYRPCEPHRTTTFAFVSAHPLQPSRFSVVDSSREVNKETPSPRLQQGGELKRLIHRCRCMTVRGKVFPHSRGDQAAYESDTPLQRWLIGIFKIQWRINKLLIVGRIQEKLMLF